MPLSEAGRAPRGGAGAHPYRRLAFHCWVLWLLGLAPMFDLLRRYPEFLLANDFDWPRVAALLLGALVIVPAPLLIAARVVRGSRDVAPLVVLALAASPSLLAAGGSVLEGWWPLVAAAGLALSAALAYRRSPSFRTFLSLLAIVALVAPGRWVLDPRLQRAVESPELGLDLAAQAARPPVVFVLLDELPAASLLDDGGEIDRRRLPSFAALADEAHWFQDVRTVSASTPRAVAAVLGGVELADGAVPAVTDVPRNLFTLLAPHYRVHAVEPVTGLCPPPLNGAARGGGSWRGDVAILALHTWAPEPLARRALPPVQGAWGGFGGGAGARKGWIGELWRRLLGRGESPRVGRPTLLRDFAAAIDGTPGRLYFLHLLLPHRPWMYLPDGGVYRPDSYREMRDVMLERWPDEPQVAARAQQRHLLQLEFTDRLLGELIERLREVGVYDASLVVVASDHGIAFRPGEVIRQPTPANEDELLRVPLLVKLPGQRSPDRHPERASTLDILPTVLSAVGVEVPPSLPGEPLLPRGSRMPARDAGPSAALARRNAVFGALDGPRALFAFGAYGELVGRRADSLEIEERPEIVVAIGRDAKYLHLTGDRPLPPWLYGYVETPLDLAGFGLVAAVDGVVVAVDEIRRVEGRNRFNLLLPAANLAAGATRLELLLAEPAGRPERLWRTGLR